MRLENKVALITGSARGIGKEMALTFAREGARVALADIHDCAPAAKEVGALGPQALGLVTDVTDPAQTQELARQTFERFGKIDILVNNAALFGGIEFKDFVKPFEQIEVEEWDRVMAVNLKGIFLCCKAVVPYMKKAGGGKIINLASTVAFSGASAFLHYTTSKGGVVSMTRALARALGEYGINVNALAPGLTSTESALSMGLDMSRQIIASQIIKRATGPRDIAAAALYLASDEANQITGEILAVNAGEYLC
jgi:NAD(P)-dependent dehydrogenase (short-subunit alcohol dehydrogenase family)